MKLPNTLQNLVSQRIINNSVRSLKSSYPKIDFASNDYLGFSSQGLLHKEMQSMLSSKRTSASGSRLISGNSLLFDEVEKEIALFHDAESSLIYNSGYDANVGLLSSVPQKGDLILSDELIHASLIDGIRLSHATYYKFKHNSIEALTDLIQRHKGSFNTIYVVLESVYSMDGDCAPLLEIAKLCTQYGLYLIVDEAHAIGVFGNQGAGLCQELGIQTDCFARIYTYGKAMGCHGAAVVGSEELKQFLINFSRSFIYTTAMPEHSLLAIKSSYSLLLKTTAIQTLRNTIHYFNSKLLEGSGFIESTSAIHCLLLPGNDVVQNVENKLQEADVFVKSIKSPTVKQHQERIRICLHAYNTKEEIDVLMDLLNKLQP